VEKLVVTKQLGIHNLQGSGRSAKIFYFGEQILPLCIRYRASYKCSGTGARLIGQGRLNLSWCCWR
jgi:hypothetical protein